MQNNTYTVGQVNRYIAGMFADDLLLKRISVKGEVGTCTYTSQGHVYFSLKDNDSQISAVIWRSRTIAGLKFKLETGMKVVVTGNVEVYERDGRYQIIATEIVKEGLGDIYERFEILKKKLEELGMFDKDAKRPIPRYVKTLGVVTAPTGAAVRDIINISKRRNPGIQIVLYPSLVQGKEAAANIIEGINALENYGVDVIIVGRGGGSMEDLWCFNDEALAHTIFNCAVPVISAVGHETDFTIADFVSDLRAPTPSAAAELAVTDIYSELRRLEDYGKRLENTIYYRINRYREKIKTYVNQIRVHSPEYRINAQRNRLALINERMNSLMSMRISDRKAKVSLYAKTLHALSPLNKLGGGYVYATAGGKGLKSVKDVKTGDDVKLNLKDGTLDAKITGIREE
ncbi:MAG: exodeoxyribonuclease VII large subunit [Lachnospiraceae bacterium]|nr:exodeoxyribonuclease VII large subunit [Lachnospiraceae bacterium]